MTIGIEKLAEGDRQSKIHLLKDRRKGTEKLMAELYFIYANQRFIASFDEENIF